MIQPKIVKNERKKDWFYSYNMIFDQPISANAKLIYLYLCRRADSDGQSFPSQSSIGKDCGIKSRQTVIAAICELESIGLLSKKKKFRENGGQTSNLYTVYDEPNTPVQNLDTPCPEFGHPPVQNLDTPCPEFGHEVLPIEVLPIVKDYPVKVMSKSEYKTDNTNDIDKDFKKTKDNVIDIDLKKTNVNVIDKDLKKTKDNAIDIDKHLKKAKKIESTQSFADQSHDFENSSITTINDHYIRYEKIIKYNINYDYYIRGKDAKLINDIIFCIMDIFSSVTPTVKINGEEKSREIVKYIYLKLNSEHIDYILEKYKEQKHKIGRKHSYIKTMLYNSLQESEAHYVNAVYADRMVF